MQFRRLSWRRRNLAYSWINFQTSCPTQRHRREIRWLRPPTGPICLSTRSRKGACRGPVYAKTFQAFTKVSQSKPWYDANRDIVAWAADVGALPSDSCAWIAIPPPTLADAIEDRKQFARKTPDEEARASLLLALEQPSPMAAFSNSVRSLGLQPQWHEFRTRVIVDKIAEWAKESGVVWKDGWLIASSAGGIAIEGSSALPLEAHREWRRQIAAVVHALEYLNLAESLFRSTSWSRY